MKFFLSAVAALISSHALAVSSTAEFTANITHQVEHYGPSQKTGEYSETKINQHVVSSIKVKGGLAGQDAPPAESDSTIIITKTENNTPNDQVTESAVGQSILKINSINPATNLISFNKDVNLVETGFELKYSVNGEFKIIKGSAEDLQNGKTIIVQSTVESAKALRTLEGNLIASGVKELFEKLADDAAIIVTVKSMKVSDDAGAICEMSLSKLTCETQSQTLNIEIGIDAP